MKNKIAFIGSHGVGKTTLLNSIPHSYKIKELARKQLITDTKPHNMSLSDRILFQKKYWQLQLGAENEKRETGFLSDRTLLDIIAYSYGILDIKEIKEMFNQCVDRYDYLFYIPIEFSLKVDEVRSANKEYQRYIDNIIFKLIQRLQTLDNKVKISTLRGSVEQRKNQFNLFINKGK